MNSFIYLIIIFLSVFVSVGCQKKSVEQKTDIVNTIEKQTTKDSVITNKMSEEYSGVYEGKISVNSGSTGYELVDGWIAFDFTGNQNIVLYDGVFREENKLVNDEIKGLGIFGKRNKQIGFYLEYVEDDFDEDNVQKSFMRKTGNIEAAKEKIKFYKEEKALFVNFYSKFKQELLNKDFKNLASYGNFPLMDYSNNSKIINSGQLENKLRSVFDEGFYKDSYNIESLKEIPGRFEDHYTGNEGFHMLQTSVLFINFKNLSGSIKIYSISHPYN